MSEVADGCEATVMGDDNEEYKAMNDMTPKQGCQTMLDRIPDAASIEDVLERLELYSAIEIGSAQCDRGETIPHEEVVAILEADCRETEAEHALVNELNNHIIKRGRDWNLKEKAQFLASRIEDSTTLDQLSRQLELLRPPNTRLSSLPLAAGVLL